MEIAGIQHISYSLVVLYSFRDALLAESSLKQSIGFLKCSTQMFTVGVRLKSWMHGVTIPLRMEDDNWTLTILPGFTVKLHPKNIILTKHIHRVQLCQH